MNIRVILFLFGSVLFLTSLAAHIYVKLRLRPGPELDEYYHEFQDTHPDQIRYEKWSTRTFTAAALGLILIFITAFIF